MVKIQYKIILICWWCYCCFQTSTYQSLYKWIISGICEYVH